MQVPVGELQDAEHRMSIDQAVYNLKNLSDNRRVKIVYEADQYTIKVRIEGRTYRATRTWLADALSSLWVQTHAKTPCTRTAPMTASDSLRTASSALQCLDPSAHEPHSYRWVNPITGVERLYHCPGATEEVTQG